MASVQNSDSKFTDFLRTSIQIGNSKGPIDYKHSQVVFHHDDVPIDKRNRKNEVLEWKKSKILSVDRGSWSKSTKPLGNPGYIDPSGKIKPVCERRTRENHVHDRKFPYQYNFRSETLDYMNNIEAIDAPTKFHVSSQLESTAQEILEAKRRSLLTGGMQKRTQEMPIHPSIEYATDWNSSTSFTIKEKHQNYQRMCETAKEATTKKNVALGTIFPYTNPMERSKNFANEMRSKKKSGQCDVLRPITEPVDRTVFRNQIAVEKKRYYTTDHHTGVWEFNPVEGRYMWSDTGSYEYESKGDEIKCHNPDAWNMTGPTIMKPLRMTSKLTNHTK